MSVLAGIGVLAGAGVVGSLLGGLAGTYRFRPARADVPLPGLRAPLRVAFLSDLHFGPFIRRGSLRRWVDATREQEPDLILLGGDMLDHWVGRDLSPLLTELARLRAPLGVYAVWGNHDHAVLRGRASPSGMPGFARALEDLAGVRVLCNAACRVRDDLFVAGVDDLQAGHPDVTGTLAQTPAGGCSSPAGRGPAPAGDDTATAAATAAPGPSAPGPSAPGPTAPGATAPVRTAPVRTAPVRTAPQPAASGARREGAREGAPTSATILLSHNPDILPRVPETVSLTLCGHTHGGQVCLPGYGALYTASAYGRRFVAGWVRAPAMAYVSRGLGVSGAPLRFACPAEITVLDLAPAGGATPAAAPGG